MFTYLLINVLYKGKNMGVKAVKDFFYVKNIQRALLVVLTTLSSALSLVFKTTPRSLVVKALGIFRVLGGLWDGRV